MAFFRVLQWKTAMRHDDKRVFALCANALNYWILVRRTNSASLNYIGQEGFTPKPIDCKAKTADAGPHAGLVVEFDENNAWQIYREDKINDARNCWEDFAAGPLREGTRGYAVQRADAKFAGCVTLDGSYIYGDYDLYDVVDPEQRRRNFAVVDTMHGQPHMRSPYMYRVANFVNRHVGADVIQHSGEAQYKDHSNQVIDVFGPDFEYFPLLNEAEIRRFYDDTFEGRKALGKGVRW